MKLLPHFLLLKQEDGARGLVAVALPLFCSSERRARALGGVVGSAG